MGRKRPPRVEEHSCSSSSPVVPPSKRARHSSEEAEQSVLRFRAGQHVLRPGVPPAISLSQFRIEDKPSPPLKKDDKEGHYVFELGENLSSRYKILSKFGEGTFGRVLECWDRVYKEYVAVKIVRNVDKYRHAAMIELEVLNTLEQNDPESKWHCVKLKEWFDYRGHVCMVFEKLGPSLYDFLRRNDYQPFPLSVVQVFARQLLEAVAYMHELNLVHTDLKPENILLTNAEHDKLPPINGSKMPRRLPRSPSIRVIDFGSATFEDAYHSTVVSTRHYRAPEVILGQGWSFPCDMWSIGCILVELVTGDALFQTHDNLEHLAMMEQVLGPIPEAICKRADVHTAKHFANGRLKWPEGAPSRKAVRQVKRMDDLHSLLLNYLEPHVRVHCSLFSSLIRSMLDYDPAQRVTAAAALKHPFFVLHLPLPVPLPEASAAAETFGAAALAAALPAVALQQRGGRTAGSGSCGGAVASGSRRSRGMVASGMEIGV